MLDYYYDIKTKEEVFVYSRNKQIRKKNDIAFYSYVPIKYKYKYKKNAVQDVEFFDYKTKQLEKFVKLEFSSYERDTYYEIQDNNETRNMHTKYLRVIEDNEYYAGNIDREYSAVVFDIEVGTLSATFPNAENGFLLAIGCKKVGDKDVTIYDIGTENITSDREPSMKAELKVFRDFATFLNTVAPDILVGYNSISFDYTYLVNRLKFINEKTEHRYSKDVYYVLDTLYSYSNGYSYLRQTYGDTDVPKTGLHYDIFVTDVMRDVTIRELRSMTLKDVSRYYGAEDVKEFEKHEMKHINVLYVTRHEEFMAYLESDIRSTELLYNKYFNVNIRLASILGVPISFITSQTNATIPALYVAKLLYTKNYIPVGTNIVRYADLNVDSIKYEGALVELWKHGYSKKLYKVDFSRMYPSAMLQFNLSPENIELYEIYDIYYTGKDGNRSSDDILWAIPCDDGVIYAIRDNNLGKRIAILVKNKRGVLCDGIETILEERNNAKKRKKIAEKLGNIKDLNDAIADEQSYKKIANALYGIFGNKYTPVGDFLIALAVTGICRYISNTLRKKFIDNDNCFVELDSVTGDTPIYTSMLLDSDCKNKLRLLDINTVDEVVKTQNREVYTRNGWCNIIGYKSHTVNKTIYRVETPAGYVDVTEDHSLFNQNHSEVTPRELSPGDNIEILSNVPYGNIYMDSFVFGNTVIDINDDIICLTALIVAQCKLLNSKLIFSYKTEDEADKTIALLNNFAKLIHINSEVTDKSIDYSKDYPYIIEIVDFNIESIILRYFFTQYYKYKRIPIYIFNASSDVRKQFVNILYGLTKFKNSTKLIEAGIYWLCASIGENITRGFRRYKLDHFDEDNDVVIANSVKYKNKSITVYDISTEDSTFVCANGNIILHNTDGFLIDKNLDLDEINMEVMNICRKLYTNKTEIVDGKELAIMHLEKEEFGGGFMYKEKNYILEVIDKDNNVVDYIIHGSAFKASTKPKAYIKAVKEFYEIYKERVINEDRINKLYDVYNMDKKDLVLTFKVSKSREEYKYTNDKITYIAEMDNIYKTARNSSRKIKAFENILETLEQFIDELIKLYEGQHADDENIDNEARLYYDSHNVNFLINQKLRLNTIISDYKYRTNSIYEIYPNLIYIYENIINSLHLQPQSINLALTLMNEYENFYHTRVNKGDYIEYYYTKDAAKYHIAEIVEADNYSIINYDKYREFIADLHKIFTKYSTEQRVLTVF